ncbi:MAG TPA: nitroreductase family protein [Syntrophorhabdaceae bacterium]
MINILRTRRSIRKYEKDIVDARSLEIMKEALLRCPTSMGRNPWTFIFVDDPGVLAHLSLAKEQGSAFLKGAPLGIVICGDEKVSDVWVEDCSIAAIVVQLIAHSLGLGTCWIQIRNRSHSSALTAGEYVQDLLGIPENVKVECIISVGFRAETKPPVSVEKLDYDKIRHNRFTTTKTG